MKVFILCITYKLNQWNQRFLRQIQIFDLLPTTDTLVNNWTSRWQGWCWLISVFVLCWSINIYLLNAITKHSLFHSLILEPCIHAWFIHYWCIIITRTWKHKLLVRSKFGFRHRCCGAVAEWHEYSSVDNDGMFFFIC